MSSTFHFTIDCDWIPNSNQSMPAILRLIEYYNLKPTFFITGKFAENYPELIQELALKGYEIGSHGWAHGIDADESFGEKTPYDIQKKLLYKSSESIEKISRVKPRLFRAPRLEICRNTFKILEELDYKIDSSITAKRFDFGFGSNNSLKNLFNNSQISKVGSILEIPPSAFIAPLNMRFLRTFGLNFSVALFKLIEQKSETIVFYLHPAEFISMDRLNYPKKEEYFYKSCNESNIALLDMFLSKISQKINSEYLYYHKKKAS